MLNCITLSRRARNQPQKREIRVYIPDWSATTGSVSSPNYGKFVRMIHSGKSSGQSATQEQQEMMRLALRGEFRV